MVIDDERDILKLMYTLLEGYGHEVDVFSEQIETLEYFRKHRRDSSLFLVDIGMQSMNGFELYQELKKRI